MLHVNLWYAKVLTLMVSVGGALKFMTTSFNNVGVGNFVVVATIQNLDTMQISRAYINSIPTLITLWRNW